MRNKNYPIKVMLDKETYDNFIKKCEDLGISMTLFIEKISNEPVVFLDKNAKLLLKELKD